MQKFAKTTDDNLPYDDDTVIQFGEHIGKTLEDAPSYWFLWCEKTLQRKHNEHLLDYIKDNYDAILNENEKSY